MHQQGGQLQQGQGQDGGEQQQEQATAWQHHQEKRAEAQPDAGGSAREIEEDAREEYEAARARDAEEVGDEEDLEISDEEEDSWDGEAEKGVEPLAPSGENRFAPLAAIEEPEEGEIVDSDNGGEEEATVVEGTRVPKN